MSLLFCVDSASTLSSCGSAGPAVSWIPCYLICRSYRSKNETLPRPVLWGVCKACRWCPHNAGGSRAHRRSTACPFLPALTRHIFVALDAGILIHCLLHDQISTRFILTVKFNTGRPQGLVYIFWALSTSGISQLSTGLVLKYSQTKLTKVWLTSPNFKSFSRKDLNYSSIL